MCIIKTIERQNNDGENDMNYQAAEAIKTNIANLNALFDKMADGEVEATDARQQAVIDRIDALTEQLSNATARNVTSWSNELASLNID